MIDKMKTMESYVIKDIINAIEDLEDMIPMLERQDDYNQTIVKHSVSALKGIFQEYKKQTLNKHNRN